MENLNILSSEIKLSLNGDKDKIITFDPGNVILRKKFYNFKSIMFQKKREFDIKAKQISEKDINKALKLEEELYDFIAKNIDDMFGMGTSKKVCNNNKNVDTLCNFLVAIAPYFKQYNENIKNKYVNNLKEHGVL